MSNKIKVLTTVQFAPELLKQIEEVSPRLEVVSQVATLLEEVPEEVWGGVEVLYTHKVLPEVNQVPDLNWIQFHRAGNDRYLQAPIVHKPGLVATTLSGAAVPQVTEHVFEMILALGHRMLRAIEFRESKTWPEDRGERFSSQELNQSTIGILGYGSIGREVARLAQAFGATVLAMKYDAMIPRDRGYLMEGSGDPEGDLVHRLYPPQALPSLLKECDFLVICLPLTDETRNMITARELASMKPTAYIVDVSRGGVIDHADLIEALQAGVIAGAALDVFPEEPLSADNPLWRLSNVILTPHIAGMSPHYNQRAVALFVENLERYIAGQDLLNQIDLQRGY
jgi:phosphoglycerate dehydrogenase-like enzyme